MWSVKNNTPFIAKQHLFFPTPNTFENFENEKLAGGCGFFFFFFFLGRQVIILMKLGGDARSTTVLQSYSQTVSLILMIDRLSAVFEARMSPIKGWEHKGYLSFDRLDRSSHKLDI